MTINSFGNLLTISTQQSRRNMARLENIFYTFFQQILTEEEGATTKEKEPEDTRTKPDEIKMFII